MEAGPLTRTNFPCRGRPFWRTLTGFQYFTRYLIPRFLLWLYVVLPPFCYARLKVPLSWSLGSRLAFDLVVIAVLTGIAYFFDRVLFGAVFDGHEEGPGIRNAPHLLRDWRTQWRAAEESGSITSASDDLPGLPALAGLSLSYGRGEPIPTFTCARLPNDTQAKTRLLATVRHNLVSRLKEVSANAVVGINSRFGSESITIVIPVSAHDTPDNASMHVWAFATPVFDGNVLSCKLDTGSSFWFAGGRTNLSDNDPSDVTKLGFGQFINPKRLLGPLLWLGLTALAFVLWPIGIVWLTYRVFRELLRKERYRSFLHTLDPRCGDTNDLQIILQARHADGVAGPRRNAAHRPYLNTIPDTGSLGGAQVLLGHVHSAVTLALQAAAAATGTGPMSLDEEPRRASTEEPTLKW